MDDKKTITIAVSEETADALAYYQFKHGVKPGDVVGSMVEYCLAVSFRQGPDLIKDFANDGRDFKPGDIWPIYSEPDDQWNALASFALAREEMRRKQELAA
jgi:hypothetical protein